MGQVVFDWDKNPKQRQFFNEVMKAANFKSDNRHFFFGGAIRGGKTSACLVILHLLARKHPNLRIHVVRKTLPVLKQTTIPSFKKLCGDSPYISGFHDGGVEVRYKNGSILYFISENYDSDKDLDRFKGLETNIIMLEQLEELQRETYVKALERSGSWYNGRDNTPTVPALVLSTFNPSPGWLKEEIYQPYKEGNLHPPKYYLQTLPTDNPFVTQDQWSGWSNMDEISYKRFVEGDWDATANVSLFMYTFSRERHLGECNLDLKNDIWLSFDFNVSPMTCLVIQDNGRLGNGNFNEIRVIKEFRELDTGIYEFAANIKKWLDSVQAYRTKIYVTGDPAGANRNGVRKGENYYHAIKEELQLKWQQFHLMNAAPYHEDSFVHCNSIVQKFPDFKINPGCKDLITDLLNVQFTDLKNINKMHKSKKDSTTLGHLLDCLRYYFHTRLPNFVKSPISS